MIELNSLAPLLQKIRSICKQCQNVPMPDKLELVGIFKVQEYLEALDFIKIQMVKFHELEEDYTRLEAILQTLEAAVRSKVGTEQQMKLYTDSLKAHINQLSLEKLQLLQNSKESIKQLKRVNQELYAQFDALKKGSAAKGKASSVKNDSSIEIKDIVKTEYVERPSQRERIKVKKSKPISHSFRLSQQPGKGVQFRQNSKTYQVVEPKIDRQYNTSSKKHQPANICSYIKISRKKQQEQFKSCYLNKDNEKNKKLKNKIKNVNRSLWRDKMANRSVASIVSMEVVSSQKQTI